MMRASPLVLGAILSLGFASEGLAQAAPNMPQIQPTRDWEVTGRVSATYDSNVARVAKELAFTRGLVAQDYIATPTVTARLVQPIGQQFVFADGSAGYDFYARNEELNRARLRATGGVGGVVGACRPMAYVNYASSQSDLADLDLRNTSNRLESITTAVGAQCGRAVGPGASVVAQRVDSKNSNDALTIQDTTQESLNASLLYNAPNLGNVSLIWSYSNSEFPNRIIPGRPVGDGFWTQTIGARIARDFGSRLSLSATGSRTLVKREFSPDNGPLKFTATTYEGNAIYKFGRRIELELDVMREVRPSGRPGKLLDLAEGAEGRVRYRLNPRISLALGHDYQHVRSNSDTATVGRPVVTNSYTNTTYGSVEFRSPGRLGLSLDVRREDRNTNLPIFNYISTRVGLTTTVSF